MIYLSIPGGPHKTKPATKLTCTHCTVVVKNEKHQQRANNSLYFYGDDDDDGTMVVMRP